MATDIEYRIVWNEISAHWEIHRNGAKRPLPGGKSDQPSMTIIAIQSEVRSPEAKVLHLFERQNSKNGMGGVT